MDDYSIHINANRHGSDVSLRVTMDYYDSEGTAYAPRTWRGHTTVPRFTSAIDDAYATVVKIALMLEKQGAAGRLRVPDMDTLF